jgi:hypothetical protein
VICPKCETEFKFKNVPLHDRRYKAWVCKFKCPSCGAWLTPGRRKTWFLNVGVWGFSISAIVLALLDLETTDSIILLLTFAALITFIVLMVLGSLDKSAQLAGR